MHLFSPPLLTEFNDPRLLLTTLDMRTRARYGSLFWLVPVTSKLSAFIIKTLMNSLHTCIAAHACGTSSMTYWLRPKIDWFDVVRALTKTTNTFLQHSFWTNPWKQK